MHYRRLLVPGLLGLLLFTPVAALICRAYFQSPSSDYKTFYAAVALIGHGGISVLSFKLVYRHQNVRRNKADIWQQLEQVANRWTVLYIRQHYLYRSRYEIDRYLLECGCAPTELELIWGVVLGSRPVPKPVKPTLPTPTPAVAPLTRSKMVGGKIALVLVMGMFILNAWLLILQPTVTPTFTSVYKTPLPSGPPFSKQELLEANQYKWKNRNIKHYRISLRITESNSIKDFTNTVDGPIVSLECAATCDSFYKRYTIDQMFEDYHWHFVGHPMQVLTVDQDIVATLIIYDNNYGFPKSFSYNPGRVNSKYAEGYEKIEVLSFEVLE
jgi:hypothetical protein